MERAVDPYRFQDKISVHLVEAWMRREQVTSIPWAPLRGPMAECTVALISSGGISRREDPPFDQAREHEDPWWGDPSFRVLPAGTTEADVVISHLHVNTSFAEQDLGCMLPLARLAELEAEGVVGRSAASHCSFMGYILEPEELLETHLPPIIERMLADGVDAAILAPV
jgi:D-proline reductase (dithiol) PrdB